MQQFPEIQLDACPLCGSVGPLRTSHVIPEFVFDWLLRTSPTGFMRFGTSPNIRVRDGMKLRLLCDSCEARLSVWEKATAEQLFLPYHNDTSVQIRYEGWLAKFCASIAWRVLFVYSQICPLEHMTKTQREDIPRALTAWKKFMFGTEDNPGRFELHILPVDVLNSTKGVRVPRNMNRYLARAVEIDVAAAKNEAFVYAKMCRLIVLGFVERPNFRRWHGSRVTIKQGLIEPRKYILPGAFSEFLADRALHMREIASQISVRQKTKANAAMRKNPDRAAQSDGFAAMLQDFTMFGRSAFDPIDNE